MRENVLTGKVSIAFHTKINIGLDELSSQTFMGRILLNSYYNLLYELKLKDMLF